MKKSKLMGVLLVAVALLTAGIFAGCSYTPSVFSVQFDLGYTTTQDAPATQIVNAGKLATKPADPTREDYDFLGWKAQGYMAMYNFDTMPVNEHLYLIAQWAVKAADLTVTFNLNYPEAPAPQTKQVASGTLVTPIANPQRTDGFTFEAWYTAATGGDLFDFNNNTITADIELFAHWIAPGDPDAEFDVVFHFNYDGADPDSQTVKVRNGETVAQIADPQRTDGYSFRGWFTEATGGAAFNFSTQIIGKTDIYAQWDDPAFVDDGVYMQVDGGTAVKLAKSEINTIVTYSITNHAFDAGAVVSFIQRSTNGLVNNDTKINVVSISESKPKAVAEVDSANLKINVANTYTIKFTIEENVATGLSIERQGWNTLVDATDPQTNVQASGYYIRGNFSGWSTYASYKMTEYENDSNYFYFTFTNQQVGDEFKVVYHDGVGEAVYYPSGYGNDIVLAEAGATVYINKVNKTISFTAPEEQTEPELEEGAFYLIGSFSGWALDANYKLTQPEGKNYYAFDIEALGWDDIDGIEFKVRRYNAGQDGGDGWFGPAEGNYVYDSAVHKVLYFINGNTIVFEEPDDSDILLDGYYLACDANDWKPDSNYMLEMVAATPFNYFRFKIDEVLSQDDAFKVLLFKNGVSVYFPDGGDLVYDGTSEYVYITTYGEVSVTVPTLLEAGFYLSGDFNGWALEADSKLAFFSEGWFYIDLTDIGDGEEFLIIQITAQGERVYIKPSADANYIYSGQQAIYVSHTGNVMFSDPSDVLPDGMYIKITIGTSAHDIFATKQDSDEGDLYFAQLDFEQYLTDETAIAIKPFVVVGGAPTYYDYTDAMLANVVLQPTTMSVAIGGAYNNDIVLTFGEFKDLSFSFIPSQGNKMIISRAGWLGDTTGLTATTESDSGYYLVGNFNSWATFTQYKLTAPEGKNYVTIDLTQFSLQAGDEFRIVKKESGNPDVYIGNGGNGDQGANFVFSTQTDVYVNASGAVVFTEPSAPATPLEEGFYLIGQNIGWDAEETDKLAVYADVEGWFYASLAGLSAGDEFAIYAVDAQGQVDYIKDGNNNFTLQDGQTTIYVSHNGIVQFTAPTPIIPKADGTYFRITEGATSYDELATESTVGEGSGSYKIYVAELTLTTTEEFILITPFIVEEGKADVWIHYDTVGKINNIECQPASMKVESGGENSQDIKLTFGEYKNLVITFIPSQSNKVVISREGWLGDTTGLTADTSDGYYLAGNFNSWATFTQYKLTAPEGKNYVTIDLAPFSLQAGDEFKVFKLEGGVATAWLGNGEDNFVFSTQTNVYVNASGAVVFKEPTGAEPVLEEGKYYLIGSFSNWALDPNYKLTQPAGETYYAFDIEALGWDDTDGIEFKVRRYNAGQGGGEGWFGPADNYKYNPLVHQTLYFDGTNITFDAPGTVHADGFYLAYNGVDWKVSNAVKLAFVDAAITDYYRIKAIDYMANGDQFKIIKYTSGTSTYLPIGTNNNWGYNGTSEYVHIWEVEGGNYHISFDAPEQLAAGYYFYGAANSWTLSADDKLTAHSDGWYKYDIGSLTADSEFIIVTVDAYGRKGYIKDTADENFAYDGTSAYVYVKGTDVKFNDPITPVSSLAEGFYLSFTANSFTPDASNKLASFSLENWYYASLTDLDDGDEFAILWVNAQGEETVLKDGTINFVYSDQAAVYVDHNGRVIFTEPREDGTYFWVSVNGTSEELETTEYLGEGKSSYVATLDIASTIGAEETILLKPFVVASNVISYWIDANNITIELQPTTMATSVDADGNVVLTFGAYKQLVFTLDVETSSTKLVISRNGWLGTTDELTAATDDGYYLAGNFNSWATFEEYKLESPQDKDYFVAYDLSANNKIKIGDEFRIVKKESGNPDVYIGNGGNGDQGTNFVFDGSTKNIVYVNLSGEVVFTVPSAPVVLGAGFYFVGTGDWTPSETNKLSAYSDDKYPSLTSWVYFDIPNTFVAGDEFAVVWADGAGDNKYIKDGGVEQGINFVYSDQTAVYVDTLSRKVQFTPPVALAEGMYLHLVNGGTITDTIMTFVDDGDNDYYSYALNLGSVTVGNTVELYFFYAEAGDTSAIDYDWIAVGEGQIVNQPIYINARIINVDGLGITVSNDYPDLDIKFWANGKVVVSRAGWTTAPTNKVTTWNEDAAGYYVLGNFNNWEADTGYKLTDTNYAGSNTLISGSVTLSGLVKGDEYKIAKYDATGAVVAWYGAQTGHAGIYEEVIGSPTNTFLFGTSDITIYLYTDGGLSFVDVEAEDKLDAGTYLRINNGTTVQDVKMTGRGYDFAYDLDLSGYNEGDKIYLKAFTVEAGDTIDSDYTWFDVDRLSLYPHLLSATVLTVAIEDTAAIGDVELTIGEYKNIRIVLGTMSAQDETPAYNFFDIYRNGWEPDPAAVNFTETTDDGYYVLGNFNNWGIEDGIVNNRKVYTEFALETTDGGVTYTFDLDKVIAGYAIQAGDCFKVVKVEEGAITEWLGDGDNNFVYGGQETVYVKYGIAMLDQEPPAPDVPVNLFIGTDGGSGVVGDSYEMTLVNGEYTLTKELAAGTYHVKVNKSTSTPIWYNTNQVTRQPGTYSYDGDGNVVFTLAADTTIVFTAKGLNDSFAYISELVIKDDGWDTSRIDDGTAINLATLDDITKLGYYVVGNFSGWNLYGSLKLTSNVGGLYTIDITQTLNVGDVLYVVSLVKQGTSYSTTFCAGTYTVTEAGNNLSMVFDSNNNTFYKESEAPLADGGYVLFMINGKNYSLATTKTRNGANDADVYTAEVIDITNFISEEVTTFEIVGYIRSGGIDAYRETLKNLNVFPALPFTAVGNNFRVTFEMFRQFEIGYTIYDDNQNGYTAYFVNAVDYISTPEGEDPVTEFSGDTNGYYIQGTFTGWSAYSSFKFKPYNGELADVAYYYTLDIPVRPAPYYELYKVVKHNNTDSAIWYGMSDDGVTPTGGDISYTTPTTIYISTSGAISIGEAYFDTPDEIESLADGNYFRIVKDGVVENHLASADFTLEHSFIVGDVDKTVTIVAFTKAGDTATWHKPANKSKLFVKPEALDVQFSIGTSSSLYGDVLYTVSADYLDITLSFDTETGTFSLTRKGWITSDEGYTAGSNGGYYLVGNFNNWKVLSQFMLTSASPSIPNWTYLNLDIVKYINANFEFKAGDEFKIVSLKHQGGTGTATVTWLDSNPAFGEISSDGNYIMPSANVPYVLTSTDNIQYIQYTSIVDGAVKFLFDNPVGYDNNSTVFTATLEGGAAISFNAVQVSGQSFIVLSEAMKVVSLKISWTEDAEPQEATVAPDGEYFTAGEYVYPEQEPEGE